MTSPSRSGAINTEETSCGPCTLPPAWVLKPGAKTPPNVMYSSRCPQLISRHAYATVLEPHSPSALA